MTGSSGTIAFVTYFVYGPIGEIRIRTPVMNSSI